MPPAGPPKGTQSRRKPKRAPKPRASSQNAQAYVSQGKAVEKTANRQRQAARAQRQTVHAQPLSPKPVRPVSVSPPRAKVQAKPLQSQPPRSTRAGKPVVTKKQERSLAVAAYDQLPSGAAKRAHVKAAQKRIGQGKGTVGDRAVVHAHKTRVEGKQRVQRAITSFNAIAGDQHKIDAIAEEAKTAKGVKPLTKRDPNPPLKAAGFGEVRNPAGAIRAVGNAAALGWKYAKAPKIVQNAPKDIAEIAVTTPSSIAKLATTTATHPKKVPGMLLEPYKELAKDPKKFITERPVSTALMVAPAVRGPGLAAGKAARLAGKQTLAREAATLPNTALREARTKSRSAGRNIVQTRADRKAAAQGKRPQVTAHEIDTRVDEAYAASQKHSERVHNAIMRGAHEEAKNRPKAERRQFLEEMDVQARSSAAAQRNVRLAREFGATAKVENGKVVHQPDVTEGRRFDTHEEAKQVAEHLNAQNQTIRRGHGGILEGDPAGRKFRNEQVPVTYKVADAGVGKFAVVPEQVQKRLQLHAKVGTSRAVPAVVLRQTRKMLTRAVLPTRPSWLSGQAIEGVARSGVAQAGPSSYLRAARLAKRHPDLYKQLAERAVPGGLGGRVAALETTEKTFRQEFPESNVARRMTEWGAKPGIRQTRKLYDSYTRFVFDKVNGRFLEGVPQKAMLGRALKQSPLMEGHLIGLSNKAIDEAARGIKNTETQVQLAREVTRSYGKYAAFSPRLRSLIQHWTPFIPWYLNTAKFLIQTLPKDHPMVSALIADANAATEDWRKEQGLSLRYRNDNSLPPWMLGGFPVQGGKGLIRIGHYVPSPSTDPTGDISGLVLPQFAGAYAALRYGLDWKGDELKHPDGSAYNEGERLTYAAQQMLEAMVPLYGQGTQLREAAKEGTAAQKAKQMVSPLPVVPLHHDKKPGAGLDVPSLNLQPLNIDPVDLSG